MGTQQPVTHVVDMSSAVDPIGDNSLRTEVQQLFPDNVTATRANIRRAPMYDEATETQRQAPTEAPEEDDLSDPSDFEAELMGDVLNPTVPETGEVTPTELPAGYEQFAKQFEQYMGVPLDVAQNTVQELTQFRQQVAIDRQLSSLSSEWGVGAEEAEARLADVRSRFSKLSTLTQNTLSADPVKSAQLIWAKLEQEKVNRQQTVPTFDKSGTRRPASLPRGAMSKSEISSMSNAEYISRQDEILEAYSRGLVV